MESKKESLASRGGAGRRPHRRSGKWALLILLALLPVALLGIFAFRTASDAMNRLVVTTNLAAASASADIVRENLQRSLRFDLSFSESVQFVEAVKSRDEESVQRYLQAVFRLHAPIYRASVHDVDGRMWSDYPPVPEVDGKDYSETEWYEGVSENWEPYISGVYRQDSEPKDLVVAIAVPIWDNEEVIGIFASQYQLQSISEGLRYVRFGENGTSFLLDPSGNIAAHSELDLQARVFDEFVSLAIVERALQGESYTGNYWDPIMRTWNAASFLPVTLTGRTWVVVAQQPLSDARSPIRRMAWNIGGAGVILALAAVGVVVVLWRSSERNRYLNEKLERRNAALKRMTIDLERSNRELEEFAYVASHDLQEPLRMVASYTQLLGRRYEGKLDETADKFIHYAVDGAKRMQALIQDLLKYSRVGTQGKPFEPVNFEAVLEQVRSNLEISIREAEAEISSDPLPTLMADPTQMVQLFQNLISNAIKFRGEEPPRIHIGAREEETEWVFSITDNGVGIEADYYEKIFVIFQRLPGEKPVSGTGLGLSMCKKIVERHGGRIWVESEVEQGSTFYFTIPVEQDTLNQRDARARAMRRNPPGGG